MHENQDGRLVFSAHQPNANMFSLNSPLQRYLNLVKMRDFHDGTSFFH
jgi:hypothetical protein